MTTTTINLIKYKRQQSYGTKYTNAAGFESNFFLGVKSLFLGNRLKWNKTSIFSKEWIVKNSFFILFFFSFLCCICFHLQLLLLLLMMMHQLLFQHHIQQKPMLPSGINSSVFEYEYCKWHFFCFCFHPLLIWFLYSDVFILIGLVWFVLQVLFSFFRFYLIVSWSKFVCFFV